MRDLLASIQQNQQSGKRMSAAEWAKEARDVYDTIRETMTPVRRQTVETFIAEAEKGLALYGGCWTNNPKDDLWLPMADAMAGATSMKEAIPEGRRRYVREFLKRACKIRQTICCDCSLWIKGDYIVEAGSPLHQRCSRKRIESRPGFRGWKRDKKVS